MAVAKKQNEKRRQQVIACKWHTVKRLAAKLNPSKRETEKWHIILAKDKSKKFECDMMAKVWLPSHMQIKISSHVTCW